MATFLEYFQRGRLLPSELARGRYRVRRSGSCDFIYQDMILNEDGMRTSYRRFNARLLMGQFVR